MKGLVFLQPSPLRDPAPEIMTRPAFGDTLLITNYLSRVWFEVGTWGDRAPGIVTVALALPPSTRDPHPGRFDLQPLRVNACAATTPKS